MPFLALLGCGRSAPNYCRSDPTGALALLDASTPCEPWEHAVAACLTVLCGCTTDPAVTTMLHHYQHLAPIPELAVFHTRLGLSVLDAADSAHHDTQAQEMIRQRLSGGFTVEPYDQEIERYGGPAAIGAAEHVFAADSSLTLTILASLRDHDQRLIIAALSAAAIARPMTDAYQAALDGRQVDRTARRHMLDLRPHVRAARGQITAGPDLSAIRPAWSARHDALTTYRQLLNPVRRADCTSSLIHMHLNRLLGDMRSERMVRALAADLLATPS